MNTSESEYPVLLDPDDTGQTKLFEQHFYRAFSGIAQQELIRRIWQWDDVAKTIHLKCNRQHVRIAVWYMNGEPVFYVACSSDINEFSQFQYYGFSAPGYVNKYMEVYTMFATEWLRVPVSEIKDKFLHQVCYKRAAEMGSDHLLATCAERMLNLYKRWGWQVLDEKLINNEKRYFIGFSLEKFKSI